MNRGSADGLLDLRGQGSRASMRPRFMNRGSDVAHVNVPFGSPRFNEAPIHESGK